MPIKHNLPIPREVEDIAQQVSQGASVSLFGLSAGEKAYFAACMQDFVLYVAADYYLASQAYNQLSSLCRAALLPAVPDILTYKQGATQEIFFKHADALNKLVQGELDVLVVSAQSLCELFAKKSDILEHIINISQNQTIPIDDIIQKLQSGGYKRTALASVPGTFSLRGDILDIFPFDREPVRIEFFGDTVDSIMTYSPSSQTRKSKLQSVTIYPATEFFIKPERFEDLKLKIQKRRNDNLEPNAKARQDRIIDELLFKLEAQAVDNSFVYISYLLDRVPLAELLPKNAVIIYDEIKLINDALNNLYNEHYSRVKSLLETGEVFADSYKQFIDRHKVFELYKNFNKCSFCKILSNNNIFEPDLVFNFRVAPITRYVNNIPELAQDLKNWKISGYSVLLSAKDQASAKSLKNSLAEQGLFIDIVDPIPKDFLDNPRIIIAPVKTGTGCVWHKDKFVLIGSDDLFPKKAALKPARAKDVFFEVKEGDYVVHFIHGIGICRGITRLTSNLGSKDYIVIEYRNGDKLYVPTEQSDLLSKYSGSNPKLSKLGGAEFAKVKQRVKDEIKKMAFDLQKLYAERSSQKGYVYEIDEELQKAFEDSFEFTETQDQRTATDEILNDMRKGVVMDRLICGDVGYGKTEVALRAAFATAMCGRQVAFLAPTTILSEQHYNTACERMKNWGLNLAVLNRFKTAKETKEILKKLKDGEIDIIFGTHRLLSKDVEFKDLGLLILDEEQRFGVEDKEKIKLIKKNVNVLSMSATPIPRTLHMSLTGIRDISLLSVPPADRLPIQTYITEFSDGLVKDAITRELSRGGQVYIVYNRSEFIDAFAAKIQSLVPEAKIEVVFGTMPEEQLSRAIKRFYDGESNVLVCTTIIENGIDLPMANTLIVCNADRFGLSQLYQLRGRVGRSNRLGYAYFTFEPDKELTAQAYKRLEALMEFTELGSGFKIALKDLEIRGAGTVLGKKQHGHMEEVGYELYTKLLMQARQELENKQAEEISECRVEADFDAYIPDDFISDTNVRMRLYNKISVIQTPKDRLDVIQEIKDVFGSLPKEVENLINIGLYKSLGVKAKASVVHLEKNNGWILFDQVTPELIDTVNKFGEFASLDLTKKPKVNIKTQVYKNVYAFLEALGDKYK
ncbi:MAG TPA: transcription-repair coupling factor [Clostridia bacterium]